jgi:hypothetical protein
VGVLGGGGDQGMWSIKFHVLKHKHTVKNILQRNDFEIGQKSCNGEVEEGTSFMFGLA